jgi:hypothetical protein
MENKMNKVIIENKSSVPLHGLGAGKQTPIEVDKAGTPLDKHWRRRLRDESIEIIKEKKKPVKIEPKTDKGDKR